jgi:hypothetical protein
VAGSTNTPPIIAEPLLDVTQPALRTVVGYQALYWLWADCLSAYTVTNGTVVGNLVLRAGSQWQQLPLTPLTLKLTETPKDSRHGTTYQVKVQGDRPQAAANVLGALETMGRRDVVLMLRQLDGQLRLVGSREEALRLLPTGSGQNPATRSGIDVLFSGTTTRLAPFYAGSFVVGEIEVPAPEPETGIRVLDGHGTLRVVVPAGYDLIIQGPFRTDLQLVPRG